MLSNFSPSLTLTEETMPSQFQMLPLFTSKGLFRNYVLQVGEGKGLHCVRPGYKVTLGDLIAPKKIIENSSLLDK